MVASFAAHFCRALPFTGGGVEDNGDATAYVCVTHNGMDADSPDLAARSCPE